MGSAGVGLVSTAPGRPVQAMGDGVFAAVDEIEESPDFREGEFDQVSISGWFGFAFAWCIVAMSVNLFGWPFPLFLVLCAAMARKVWASMARVMCRCQASQVRTW